MPKLLSFPMDGGEVKIAVRTPDDDISPVGVLEDTIEKVHASLGEVFQIVTNVARAFQESLTHVEGNVREAELEMGLQFTAKGTIYVVESEGQASFKVKLVFEPPKKPVIAS